MSVLIPPSMQAPRPPRAPAFVRAGLPQALALAATLALAGPTAHAQSSTPSEQPLAHLQHTSWGLKDGMPGPVMAIAQTSDGYLWLGTGSGLFRFDGLRFERFDTIAGEQLPSRQVLSLFATSDNGLWVGLLEGGLALVRQGRIVQVEPATGHFVTSTRAFAAERDGTLWVATGRSLLKRQGKGWVAMDPASGFDDGSGHAPIAMSVAIDAADNVWCVTDRTVFVRPAGTARFVATEVPSLGQTQLVIGPDGRAWANDTSAAVRGFFRLPLPGEGASAATGSGGAAADAIGTVARPLPVPRSFFMPGFDQAGRLWYGAKDGLNRIDPAAVPARPPASAAATASAAAGPGGSTRDTSHQFLGTDKGLSGELVMRVFQDRDGAIWVGTNGGLDRFRGAAVDRVELPNRGASIAMAVDGSGGLLVAAGDSVQRLAPGDTTPRTVPTDPGMTTFTAVFVDSRQRLWVGGRTGLWKREGDRFEPVPTPDGQPWPAAVFEITEDAAGALWFNGHRYGLMRHVDGKTTRLSGSGPFPRNGPDAIAADAQGRIWIGYSDGTLLRHEAGQTTRITPADGLKIGAIKVIARQGTHLWIGGERGVQLLSEPGFPPLRLADADALDGVSGIVETPEGELWLNGANGITRLRADEVRRALSPATAAAQRPAGRRFDLIDGLTGRAEQSWPLRTAVRTPDGLLWFSLSNGIVRIDPRRLAEGESPPPPVDIHRLSVHGEPVAAGADGVLRLAPGTRDLQIAYTAISLAQPERTRFRYRLVGQDRDWQDAGARRAAFYTNLGPGAYEFRVEASQDRGPWSATPAILRFEIAPTLTQHAGFRAAAVVTGIALLVGLAALRGRQRRAHEQDRLAARIQERERIARDLHDTLLQGVYGLILRFEAIARRLPGTERAAMERVLVDADALLIEGRDRVTDLRLPPPDLNGLEQTLQALGRELSHTHGAAFELTVDGTPRPLAPALGASICLIAREAIFNAFQHAQAGRIEVVLRYGDAGFTLFVRDDGVGVPDEVKARGGRPGHWGLSGMRERAELAGVAYRLDSQPGIGTQVELHAPAARAYEGSGDAGPATTRGPWWRRTRGD